MKTHNMDEDSIRLWIIEKCLESDNPTELFYLIQRIMDELESEMTQHKYLVYPDKFNFWEDVRFE